MVAVRTIVTNASVVVRWFFADEPLADEARRILLDFQQERIMLVAPNFCLWEVANAFWVGVRRGRITSDEAKENWWHFTALGLQFLTDPEPIAVLAFALRFDLSVYDSLYLLATHQIGGEFWTADDRLVQAVQGQLPFIRWLGDYR